MAKIKPEEGQVLVAKDGMLQVLSQPAMISAYLNSGWELVENETKSKEPSPKTAKAE